MKLYFFLILAILAMVIAPMLTSTVNAMSDAADALSTVTNELSTTSTSVR